MTRAEVFDLYYRTLVWKEIYYETQAKMDAKKDSAGKHRVLRKNIYLSLPQIERSGKMSDYIATDYDNLMQDESSHVFPKYPF